MTKLKCSKCGTETNSKFCPNCGNKVIEAIRSKDEIEYQMKLIRTAMDVLMKEKDESGLFLIMHSVTIDTVLSWCIGKSDLTPLQLLIRDKDKDNEKLKTIIEASKLGVAKDIE